MTEVSVKGNLDGAIKRFKVKCSRDGVLSDVKKRKYYSKPGVVRREILSTLEKEIKDQEEKVNLSL